MLFNAGLFKKFFRKSKSSWSASTISPISFRLVFNLWRDTEIQKNIYERLFGTWFIQSKGYFSSMTLPTELSYTEQTSNIITYFNQNLPYIVIINMQNQGCIYISPWKYKVLLKKHPLYIIFFFYMCWCKSIALDVIKDELIF